MASNSPSSKNTLPQASNHQKPHQGDCVVGFVKVSTNDSQFAQEMWMSPYIPPGQTFPDFYKIKPKPNPKALEAGPVMSTYFGGPIYDETTKSWLKTYLVQEGGKLLVESPTEYPVAQLAGRDKHKSKQARMALESITQAAGKLWVPICTCRSQPSEQLSAHKSCNHSLITMSGFWLQGDKFVTAAHFLDIQEGVQDHQKSDTITYLKCLKHLDIDDSANGLRARVSSEVWAAREQDYDNGDDMRVFHVYLHSLNSEADIAIFRILPGEKHRPQHAIREDQLSTSAAMNPHTLHNALFSVFYAGNDRPIAEYRTSDPLKEAKAWNSGCEKVFEFLARDSAKQQKLSNRDTMHVPTFEEVFLPDKRAAAIGQLVCPETAEIANERTITITREHTIVGYYGCSGAMVGTFQEAIRNEPGTAQASLEVKIIGIFDGEQGVNNALKAFAPGAIEFMRGE